jgi:VIT1/CCC1 family predicted Fe2+/Mn2+ transporter
MESSTKHRWRPAPNELRWAWLTTIALVSGGIVGIIAVVLSDYLIGAVGIVVVLVVAFMSMVGFWGAVGRSKTIPPPCKRQLRRNLLFLGPVAVAQLLAYNYFPNSGFSGLGGATNATRA